MKDKARILVAYDGSDYADAAIEDMRHAGFPTKVDAVVLSVIDAWGLPEVIGSVSSRTQRTFQLFTETIQSHLADVKGRIQTQTDAAAVRVREMFPGWSVSAEARLGKPAWEIIEKSDEWEADLIVLGPKGRTALGRLLLGSVSQKVLSEARCSVRISRKQSRKHSNESRRILVAVDGSANADAVIMEVASRQWAEGTEVCMIAVDNPFAKPAAGYVSWNLSEDKPKDTEESRAWVRRVIDSPTQILKTAGLTVSNTIEWGDAGAMILKKANDWQADSIFMGARGLGRFQRFWLGSVSSSVAARAKCSVEVVRTSSEFTF